jgi:hypothetical protein
VWRLSEYWKQLPSESPLKKSLAPPEVHEAQYLIPAGVAALGAWACASGAIVIGALAVLVGIGIAAWMQRRAQETRIARETWNTDSYCVRCPSQFSPKAW